jgi:hypothetical protein
MLISEQFVLRLKHLNLFVAKGVGDHLLERDFLEHIDLHEMQEVAQGMSMPSSLCAIKAIR